MSRTKIFISYSHEDERWRKKVTSQLAVLDSEGLIELWDDRKIGAGDDWFTQIDEQMLNARIAVLLISSAFLTSEFIRKKEIPTLFERHKQDGMTIYPLLMKDCAWQEVAWLAKMELRPPGTKPVASYRGSRVDEVLAEVAREIGSIARAQSSAQAESKKQQEDLSHPLEITILPIESTFPTTPTPLDAMLNQHWLRSGKEKNRRYYKIGLRNRNESKTVKNIRAEVVDLQSLELNSETIPLHLQSKNLLSNLKSHFPLRLCFTENRQPPYKDHIDLNPEGKEPVDVIRWEYDGEHQPTFFLCHTKEGISGEIPLGKYQLTLKITAAGVPGQEKTIVIGKHGQEFNLWFQETTFHV